MPPSVASSAVGWGGPAGGLGICGEFVSAPANRTCAASALVTPRPGKAGSCGIQGNVVAQRRALLFEEPEGGAGQGVLPLEAIGLAWSPRKADRNATPCTAALIVVGM